MTFPDCRLDETYNEDFLDSFDTEYIKGFDYCLETVVNLFEDNLVNYAGELEVDTEVDVDKFLDKAKGEIIKMIEHWVEMERDQMITSMIDSMEDDEYEECKKKGIERNEKRATPKVYKDTRSF